MKKITVVASVSIVILSVLFLMASSTNTRQLAKVPAAGAKGFAVLELFTSQGCSSCPPADELLGQYALQNNKQIITLAFHVDYWNRLGWTDSFSSSKYSQRQRDYAANFNLGSVYTPQLVINGKKELVGSESTQVATAIENALGENAAVQLSISDIKTEGSKIYFNYRASGEVENINIKAALVQAKVFTHIKSGENQGVKEMSYNVVRDFVTTAVHSNEGVLSLQLPAGTTIKDFTIVLLAQHTLSGNIKGAVQTVL
jgi:hypothetical protein